MPDWSRNRAGGSIDLQKPAFVSGRAIVAGILRHGKACVAVLILYNVVVREARGIYVTGRGLHAVPVGNLPRRVFLGHHRTIRQEKSAR